MLRYPKRLSTTHAHRLEKPVAIHETAVVDGNDGLLLRYELAVEENGHAFLMRFQLPGMRPFCEQKDLSANFANFYELNSRSLA
jgi:hypothetical protein